MIIIITCEHGGNKIPKEYQYLFKDAKDRLASHEGWDIGALAIAKIFAKEIGNYFFYSEISRLLVELNRSLHHPKLFSDITKNLNKEEKQRILNKYYFPYRHEVEEEIKKNIRHNKVLHLSIHSFTPVLNNVKRDAAIGLLFDPTRLPEKKLCYTWRNTIKETTKYNVRLNYPYQGKSDGFISYLRKKFSEKKYVGIEVEVNQRYLESKKELLSITHTLIASVILAKARIHV